MPNNPQSEWEKADETIRRFRRKPIKKRERTSDKSRRVIPAEGPTSAGREEEKPLVHTAASRPEDGRRKSWFPAGGQHPPATDREV